MVKSIWSNFLPIKILASLCRIIIISLTDLETIVKFEKRLNKLEKDHTLLKTDMLDTINHQGRIMDKLYKRFSTQLKEAPQQETEVNQTIIISPETRRRVRTNGGKI